MLRLAGTRPPESSIRAGLAAGVDAKTADRLISEFSPESRQYFTDRTTSGQALRMAPRRHYLATTADSEIPLSTQLRYATLLGVSDPAKVATGHLPMLVQSAAVTTAVQRLLTDL